LKKRAKQRFRRTKTEIEAGISLEQAIEARKQTGAKEKKPRIRRTKEEIEAGISLADVKQKRGLEKVLEEPLETKEKRPRFKRTKAEIAQGLSIEQAIEARKQTQKQKKAEKPKRGRGRPRKQKIKEKIKEPKEQKEKPEPESRCGVKIVVSVVKVNGKSRIKIGRDAPPELAPCEEILFKITYEKDHVPVNSVFDQARKFTTALAQCMGVELSLD
jgi:hypothetical protein